jgi:hypothetical protein
MAKLKATAIKVEPRLDYKENKTLNIYPYDFDNKYPQRVIDIINDSPTSKTCLKLKDKFVFGGGFKDLTFYKSKVNDRQTVDSFLRRLIKDFSRFGGFAIHVNYNGLGQKISSHLVPFEYVRRSMDKGMFDIYDDWGNVKRKAIDEKLIDKIGAYDPENAIREGEAIGWENYKGQLFYYNGNEEGYPISPLDAILENMLTEGQLKKFKHSISAKNFMASHLLVMGKQESDEAQDEFDENLRQFQGGEGAGTIMIVERESNEEIIELKKVEIQNYDGLYEYTENSSRDIIINQFLIPPVLLLRVAGTLGTSKEIADAFDYYNAITSDERLVIEETFKELFSNWYAPINPSNDYSLIPLKYAKAIEPEYFPYYSANEIRISNGDDESRDSKADNSVLAVTLGVGGTQSLTAILSDVTLSLEQKKGTLKVLFSLSDEQITQMLGQ